MCGKIGRSLRDAAVNCLLHAQSLTPRAPTARRDITGERNRAVITGDRGNWKGTTAGGAKLTAQQLARHEAALQPARTKATDSSSSGISTLPARIGIVGDDELLELRLDPR